MLRVLNSSRTIQRKRCACGREAGPEGECDACKAKRLGIQRSPSRPGQQPAGVPGVVRDVLGRHGQPLDGATRQEMERRFGTSFADVRVHQDDEAGASARAIQAQAYTFGRHVVFGRGMFVPGTSVGSRLLAHELSHVLQQRSAGYDPDPAHARLAGPELAAAEHEAERAEAMPEAASSDGGMRSPGPGHAVQRKTLGTKFTHPASSKSPFKKMSGQFDGARFTLFGDGKQLMQIDAQSGRPYTVREADAKACGGDKDDSYLNNPRYVGISDNGPIPEGTFSFKATQMATFSFSERMQMLPGGNYTDPFGVSLHGGDWGAGRVRLSPISIVPGKKGCGNTLTRSGFFLHGGIMPGSSGCIDIGNSGVDELVKLLAGYTGSIVVTVKYTAAAPSVGAVERGVGRFTYPKKKDPSLWDRIKAGVGMED